MDDKTAVSADRIKSRLDSGDWYPDYDSDASPYAAGTIRCLGTYMQDDPMPSYPLDPMPSCPRARMPRPSSSLDPMPSYPLTPQRNDD